MPWGLSGSDRQIVFEYGFGILRNVVMIVTIASVVVVIVYAFHVHLPILTFLLLGK